MNFKLLTFYLLIALFVACAPQTTKEVVEVVKESTPPLTAEEKMCRTFSQLGNRSEEALTAFVLYKDQVKMGNFEEAYPLWKQAFSLAPKADGRKTYHYDDGVKIYAHMFNKSTSEEEKSMWVDSVKYLYQRRKMCYGDEAVLSAREGFDMYYTFKKLVSDGYILDLFKVASDSLGQEIPYYAINPFSAMLVNMMGNKSIESSVASKYALILLDAIEYGNETCGTECEPWIIINGYALDRLEALEGYPDFYPCEYYSEKYYPEFLANNTDCEIIEKVGIRLRRGGCSLEDEELQAISEAYKANCKSENTITKGPLSEAYTFYRNGDYANAITKFDEYLSTETDPEKSAKTQLIVAKIYYRDIKNFPLARKYAREAASSKPNWGEPYILIGKLYASSGPICGPGTGWDSQIVTWPAIDKWQYAKKIDSSVAGEANKLINTYAKYMPAIEEVFSRPNVKEGGPFYVGCWIKENTSVRAAK